MSAKADSHIYVIGMDSMKEHTELYAQAHTKSFYSKSFKEILLESKRYCADVSTKRFVGQEMSDKDL